MSALSFNCMFPMTEEMGSFQDIYVLQRHDGQYSDKSEKILCCSTNAIYVKRVLIFEYLTNIEDCDSYWVIHKIKSDTYHPLKDRMMFGEDDCHEIVLQDDIGDMYKECIANGWKEERLGLLDVMEKQCFGLNLGIFHKYHPQQIPGHFVDVLEKFYTAESLDITTACRKYVQLQHETSYRGRPEQQYYENISPIVQSEWATKNQAAVLAKMRAFVANERSKVNEDCA